MAEEQKRTEHTDRRIQLPIINDAITFENEEGSIAENTEEKLVITFDKEQAAKLLVHLVKNLIK